MNNDTDSRSYPDTSDQRDLVAAVTDTVRSEWGSVLCYRDPVDGTRNCGYGRGCRCKDIAGAIMSDFKVSSSDGGTFPDAQAGKVPPLAALLKEVDPGLADVLTDNAAYVRVIRGNVIEGCAKVLDRASQDWHRIRDPGMANNAKSYARQIRALSLPSTGCAIPAEGE